MNREVGFELRGFEDTCQHLCAVYTKCLKTVFNGTNIYRFKNFILFHNRQGRWCISSSERAMTQGSCVLRSTSDRCDDPSRPEVRWEMWTGDSSKGRDGWLPCSSLTVSKVTFRYVHHWRTAFVSRQKCTLQVQGMQSSLSTFNGFYRPLRGHSFPEPSQKKWTAYKKCAVSSLTSRNEKSEAADTDAGTGADVDEDEAADADADAPPAYLIRDPATGRWAFSNALAVDFHGDTSEVVASSTEPLMHPTDFNAEWRLRENLDSTYRLVGVAIKAVSDEELANIIDAGRIETHRPIKINFRHIDGDVEVFYGTDRKVESETNVHYISATPRFIFRNSFGKYMVANRKEDVDANRGIYRRFAITTFACIIVGGT